MSTDKRIIVLAAGVLLAGLAQAQATRSPELAAASTTPDGFLTKARRSPPDVARHDSESPVEAWCAQASRNSTSCPPQQHHGPVVIADDLTAGLPNLRLDIILREMTNDVVSGSGVEAPDGTLVFAMWKIVSANADASIPAPADPEYGLPAPPPGESWPVSQQNYLFQGIILNGCLGPASFDLTLDSKIHQSDQPLPYGQVHLVDSVDGHGYYNFKYTIRATDEEGNVSDFTFSGDANAYCTSQADFASKSVEEVMTLSATTQQASLLAATQDDDFFTQADIDRSPGGYALFVPGVGDVYATEIRSAVAGKTCNIHKPSLIKAIAEDPPTVNEPTWEELSIHYIFFPYRVVCLWPPGGACYIMVRKAA